MADSVHGGGPAADLAQSTRPARRLWWEAVALEVRLVPQLRTRALVVAATVAPLALLPTGVAVVWASAGAAALVATVLAGQELVRARRNYRGAPFAGEVSDACGYKLATLCESGEAVFFRGLTGHDYGVDASARCGRGSPHAAPADGCHCGFHAFSDARRARAHWHWYPDSVLLEVELFGQLVRHRHGWRAEEQVVVAAYVRPVCRNCGERAEGVIVGPPSNRRDIHEALKHDRLVPTCGSCTSGSLLALSVLAARLGTEVRWAW